MLVMRSGQIERTRKEEKEMSESEIRRATVLRDMEDELELQRLEIIKSAEDILGWFEERREAKRQQEERLLLYFSYSMFIVWVIIMGVLVVLSL